jgi:nucleotide-binding universal stress UspA family protein
MRVLIAVEDKVFGEAIAEFVGSHKWEEDSKFRVIHASSADELYKSTASYCCDAARDVVEERERRARALVKGVATQIATKLGGVQVNEEIVYGKAKEVILEEAENWKADVIVMGSHGLTGFSRFLLGSVSLSVLSQAPCSVMIVKLPELQEKLKQSKEKLQKAGKQSGQTEFANKDQNGTPVASVKK